LLWVITGGILLITLSRATLFFGINGHYSHFADVFMFYITWLGQAEIIIPFLLFLMVFRRYRNWWYFITALLCNIIPFFIQQALKYWLNEPRPRAIYKGMPGMHYLPEWPELFTSSFPSGHTVGAFSFFCLLSLLLDAQYRIFGLLFFIMALCVAYSRIYLTAHFFNDVYFASIIGTCTTIVIYTFMERRKSSFISK
jgi:membrane-associated phospholipid phosphatase